MNRGGSTITRMVVLHLLLITVMLFSNALAFLQCFPSANSVASSERNCCHLQRQTSHDVASVRRYQTRSTSSDGTSVPTRPISGFGASRERMFRGGRLWMSSSAAPPVKPPKKRGWGGGGRGDDLYVRELVEPEKSALLTTWRDFAKADGGERFAESIQILNDMIAWRSGVIAARKRRFTLACCKGTAVQAVACVQIGPKNESVRSFLAQDACMSLCLLIVDPQAPMFKSGAHLCKEIKEIGRSENMAVDFQPIKDIYSGRFYAATLAM